jgi:uncharacterized protein
VTRWFDANVLIAAVVVDHVHHAAAERALARDDVTFATCPLTELALIRFLVREGTPAEQAAAVLDAVSRHPRHRAWSDDPPASDVRWGAAHGHRQVTDAYLAALARIRGGWLLTLDRGLAAAHPEVTELVEAGDH